VSEVTPSVLVTFTTDDSRTATSLQLTTDLGVQLPLTYTPTRAASGTLTLRHTYLNNAGESKSGSLNIPYRATTDDSVVGTPSPTSLAVVTGTSAMVTVSFATDDANPASGLSVTSGLAVLPAGWSSTSSSFACTSVSAGGTCEVALTYQPTSPNSGSLALGFTYTNDSGSVNTGTVSIPYTATP
jgi:hypothetical protein